MLRLSSLTSRGTHAAGVKLKSKKTKAAKDTKERVEAWQRDHRERGVGSSKGPRSSRELVRISMMG